MNSKSLLPLALLAAGAGALAWFGSSVGPKLGLRSESRTVAPAADRGIAAKLSAATIRKIELTANGSTTVLEKSGDVWTQPGNWPVVQSEARRLIETLTNLKSRFVAIPYDSMKLSQFGLAADQKPIVVNADIGIDTVKMSFGRPDPRDDEALFDRPTYCQIEGSNELLRLSPDVYVRLDRPGDSFRRRQLVPDAERVKITGGEPAPNPMNPTPPVTGRQPLLTDAIQSIRVTTKDGSITIKRTESMPTAKPDPDRPTGEPVVTAARIAQAWEIVEPVRDRIDPVKLRSILTAIPELWAESFVTGQTVATAGLDKPEQSIAITKSNGQTLTLRLGKESRRVSRLDGPPPSPFNPRAQPPQMINEVYAFSKLDDNPSIFEVRTDKLTDLFAKLDELRDASVARFETADVSELAIAKPGQPAIKLTKRKGNKDAEKEDDKQDRWYVGEGPSAILAETQKVTELLDALGKLEARNSPSAEATPPMLKPDRTPPNVQDNPDEKKKLELGLNTPTLVTVTAQGRVAPGDTPLPTRTYSFQIGKQDADRKKLAVMLAGWPTIRSVDDAVIKLIDRPALAYRGRRLLDTADAKLTEIAVSQNGTAAFALRQADAKWSLTAPLRGEADEAKANEIAGSLSRLEAVEFVNDSPRAEDLAKYGLDKPRLSVNLTFTGGTIPTAKLDIGAAREGKSEAYARLNGTGSVFAVANAPVESVEKGAVALIPLQLWQATSDKVASIEIRRSPDHANETYKLLPEGANWKLTGAFEAPASLASVQNVIASIANVKAERCDALAADPDKHGLDQPLLRLNVGIRETREGKESIVTKSLIVGKTVEAGPSRYAMLDGDGSKAVYVIPETVFKDADRPALDLLDRQPFTLDAARIAKVQFTTAKTDEAVTLTRDDKGTWKPEGAAFGVDKPTIESTLAVLTSPRISRFASYGATTKWADYGLESPSSVVTVTLNPSEPAGKPETKTFKLGRIDTTGERFARIDDGPGLAVLDKRTSDALAVAKFDFADRTLLTFDPSSLVGMARTKGMETLELNQNATSLAWELTKPAQHKADGPTIDELADSLGRLRAVRVVAFDTKDLKPYGLDAPSAVLALKVGLEKAETRTLSLGGPVDPAKVDGDRYVRVDGLASIGILPSTLANKLLADPIKFRDRNLAKFNDEDRIQMVRGDRTVTFTKSNGTWKMSKPIAGDAEQADLDEIVNSLAKLRADDLIADNPKDLKPYGLDKPESIWTVFSGDKEILGLSVGSKSGTKSYMQVKGSPVVALADEIVSKRLDAEYRKRAAWTGVDAAQVETVAVSSGANNFSLRKIGPLWADPANPNQAYDTAKITELLDALAGLKAERYAADEKADFKLYGLEPPERVIVVTQRGLVKTLHLGRTEGGTKRVYARVVEDGRSDVLILSEADAEKLTKDRTAYRK